MSKKIKNNLSVQDLAELSKILKAMSHPARLWILQFLAQQNSCYSGVIADELPISRSTISEHLKQLKTVGLIKGSIERPKIKYCIDEEKWEIASDLIQKMINQLSCSTTVKSCVNSKKNKIMEIKVLGPGCPKCKTLEKITNEVISENNIQANVEKIEDIMKIMEYGVMRTPAFVINGKVAFSGRVPSKNELLDIINKA